MSIDFANRANAPYIDQLYERYRRDPAAVPEEWRAFFDGFEVGVGRPGTVPAAGQAAMGTMDKLAIGVREMVHAYRELGHFVAQLDPLGHNRPMHPLLNLSEFALTPADLERQVGPAGFMGKTDGTVRDLIEKLKETYCRTIGVEYMLISDKAQRDWLAQRMEPVYNRPAFSAEECRWIMKELVDAQGFEEYVHTKYVGAKRFSLEGAEAFIPLLNTIIEDGAALGIDQFVMGMAHRGRLNTLAHVLYKPYEVILSEFEGVVPQAEQGDGDVKYHLGYSNDRVTRGGRKVHVSLSFNPSHLELVNPVVEGIVRAKQYAAGDLLRSRAVPVLIHGDAAFTGQGVVLETLGLSEMPYWRTGGTIHIIINNQVGFTTLPKQGRFTPYPTDVAKTIQAPIFHVNGDDPEACVWAAKLAVAFRQQFHCDVMIDLWCYRKYGHNEVDEPSFTQPLMYKEISEHPSVRDIYEKKLEEERKIAPDDVQHMKADVKSRLDTAMSIAQQHRPTQSIQTLGGLWTGMTRAGSDWSADTAVPPEMIRQIAEAMARLPEGFTVHPKLRKLLQQRVEMGEGKIPVDWGMAEALALGSLVLEGTPIRFVGQDTQRGTFSHRHACLHDFVTGKKYYPLANLDPQQSEIIIVNTMLSELAVVGFEYGFASADPRNLVVWEAQFGDFVNGAQPIIDQFIAAGESKWQKFCGLVMLLPHGFEGQGPEHSNAYMERFLSLCAEDNMQVCVPSLSGQYFHLLRRQIHRSFRKPLILMMPKSLLRSEAASSKLEEFTRGSFQVVIDDPVVKSREQVRRLLLCSGKVYFTLNAAREKHGVRNAAIVRVEQLYPYPKKELQAILSKYNRATEIGWVQEEPKNRGAWTFMEDRLRDILPDGHVLTYFGRRESASPATGLMRMHRMEEQELIAHALELPMEKAAEVAPMSPPKKAVEETESVSG